MVTAGELCNRRVVTIGKADLALFRSGALTPWAKWVSLAGAIEPLFRLPMIALNRPSGGPRDVFLTIWQIGIGIALLRSRGDVRAGS